MDANVLQEWDRKFTTKMTFNAGIDFDIERIIYSIFYEFDKNQQPRFTIFSKVWRESKLGLIFCGRESLRDLYDLTGDIFYVIKQYIKPIIKNKDNNILIRYAGVYMLYAFYFKQPCRPRERIKLSYTEFTQLSALMDDAKRDMHYDILYAWSKLILYQAFQYSVVGAYLGLEVGKAQERRELDEYSGAQTTKTCFQSREFKSIHRRLSKAHDDYLKMKAALSKNAGYPEYSLASIDVGLMDKINKLTSELNEESFNGDSVSSKVSTKEDIGVKRKMLKDKYFSSAEASNCESQLRDEVGMNNDEEDEWTPEFDQQAQRRRGKRERKTRAAERGVGKNRRKVT